MGSFLLALPEALGMSEAIGMVLGIVSIIFLWCWIVLWIKRYHDAGKSGWMSLLPIVVYIILFLVIIFGYAGEEISNLMAVATDPDASVEAEAALDAKIGGIPFLLGTSLFSAIVAFGFNSLIKSDPDDNQFGPAT